MPLSSLIGLAYRIQAVCWAQTKWSLFVHHYKILILFFSFAGSPDASNVNTDLEVGDDDVFMVCIIFVKLTVYHIKLISYMKSTTQ